MKEDNKAIPSRYYNMVSYTLQGRVKTFNNENIH